MWPTLNGTRKLLGKEASLVRMALQSLTQRIENLEPDDNLAYGIDWFDQWDCDQQVWLLLIVGEALLLDSQPPSPAAMFDATVDVLYQEVVRRIADEIGFATTSWREAVVQACGDASARSDLIATDCEEEMRWARLTQRLADAILGPTAYQSVEPFRDRAPQQVALYLTQKGLPGDYLSRIPTLPSKHEASENLTRLTTLARGPSQ